MLLLTLFAGLIFSSLDCVLQLINYGADMDAECGRQGNETPLLATIQFNHPPCLRILLDKGANFDPPAG